MLLVTRCSLVIPTLSCFACEFHLHRNPRWHRSHLMEDPHPMVLTRGVSDLTRVVVHLLWSSHLCLRLLLADACGCSGCTLHCVSYWVPLSYSRSSFVRRRSEHGCVRGVDSARWPNSNPPCGVAQEGLLIPVIGSAVGGTKRWQWVRHVEEWSIKHAVSV